MSTVKKTLTSETTKNVALGTAGTAGTLATLISLGRTYLPQVVSWEPSADAAVITVASTVLIPVVSRIVAFIRDPSKKKRSSGYYGAP